MGANTNKKCYSKGSFKGVKKGRVDRVVCRFKNTLQPKASEQDLWSTSKKIRVLSLFSTTIILYFHWNTFHLKHIQMTSLVLSQLSLVSVLYNFYSCCTLTAVLWRSICVRLVHFRSFTCLSQTEDTDCEPIFKLDFDTGFFSLLFFFFSKWNRNTFSWNSEGKKVRTQNKSFTIHVLLRGCLEEFDHEAQMETITSWQWDTLI